MSSALTLDSIVYLLVASGSNFPPCAVDAIDCRILLLTAINVVYDSNDLKTKKKFSILSETFQ
jgi:hypothetical protein